MTATLMATLRWKRSGRAIRAVSVVAASLCTRHTQHPRWSGKYMSPDSTPTPTLTPYPSLGDACISTVLLLTGDGVHALACALA